MPPGNYGELNKDKLKSWVQGGGTLILTEEAVQWAATNGLTNVGFKKGKEDTLKSGAYAERNSAMAHNAWPAPFSEQMQISVIRLLTVTITRK